MKLETKSNLQTREIEAGLGGLAAGPLPEGNVDSASNRKHASVRCVTKKTTGEPGAGSGFVRGCLRTGGDGAMEWGGVNSGEPGVGVVGVVYRVLVVSKEEESVGWELIVNGELVVLVDGMLVVNNVLVVDRVSVVDRVLVVGKELVVSGEEGVMGMELVISGELVVSVVGVVDRVLIVDEVLVVDRVSAMDRELIVGKELVERREEGVVGKEHVMSGELVVDGEYVAGGGCIATTKVKNGSSSTASNRLCISSSLGL